jgi:hypothetical protein
MKRSRHKFPSAASAIVSYFHHFPYKILPDIFDTGCVLNRVIITAEYTSHGFSHLKITLWSLEP